MKILKQYPKAKTRDEALGYILETAGKLGIRITDEEMAEADQELMEELKAKADAVTKDMQALDDDDLEEVAGGVHWFDHGIYTEGCRFDFTDDDCYLLDACDWASEVYYGCDGSYYSGYNAPCSKDYWDKHFCNIRAANGWE